jgi:hypothetical protein
VTQSSLSTATDLASVLHDRVERISSRTERRTYTASTSLVAGLAIPSTHVTNPTYKAALRELESLISQRADWLADEAASAHPAWYRMLLAASGATRDDARARIREVAAHRERFNVQSDDILGQARPDDTWYVNHHDSLARRLQHMDFRSASRPTEGAAPELL